MIKNARTDYPVNSIISSRWSPYGFSSKAVSAEDLCSIFEAARWARSSYNEQPWRYLVALRTNEPAFAQALSCLSKPNQAWAKFAPVLAFGIASRRFSRNDRLNRVALHDLGLASATLTLEATSRRIHVHQMAGILPDRVRELYSVPESFDVVTGLAIGHRADESELVEPLLERDQAPRSRRPISEFVFGET